jgi:RecB family exonuclease
VRVTPSTVDSIQRCSLRWLLERHGGATSSSPEQSIGNLVHAAAVLAGEATIDRAALVGYVADRFDAIELSARWLVGRERERADAMLDKLIRWLAGNPRRLVGIEREFLVELADPTAPVEIRGRVDRLELDADGRLVVIDLKTGRSAPVGAELAEHAQLAAYQVAIEAGAFAESSVPGGALLLQLGGAAAAAREQAQPPLADALDPGWAVDLIRRTAKTMAASTFEAVANNQCRVCPVRTSCPVSGKGHHVVTHD